MNYHYTIHLSWQGYDTGLDIDVATDERPASESQFLKMVLEDAITNNQRARAIVEEFGYEFVCTLEAHE